MIALFALVAIGSSPCVSSLMFNAELTNKEPGMQDVLEISKNAKALGDIYKKSAAAMPSEHEESMAVMTENAKTVGSMDEAIAADIATAVAVEQGPCAVECARDYAALCPKLWTEAAGGMCMAPASYEGPCEASAYLGAFSDGDKVGFEKQCAACWPCGSHAGVSSLSPSGPVR